jgi:lipopolysaccharide export system protein LptA
VLGSGSTFSVTNPTVTLSTGSTGDVTVATGGTTKYMQATASGAAVTPSTTYIKGTASGANTAWNSKDSVTVLTNNTSISVTKGS